MSPFSYPWKLQIPERKWNWDASCQLIFTVSPRYDGTGGPTDFHTHKISDGVRKMGSWMQSIFHTMESRSQRHENGDWDAVSN
jgi:hypothetical protein